jgi:endonuclease III
MTKKNFWWIQQEKEIGDRLRETKKLSRDELNKIIEWKFESNPLVKTVQLNRMKKINQQLLEKVSNEVFNLDVNQDMKRIALLCGFNGIGPAVASVILAFYDPENYCVVDFHVFQELFGFRPKFLTPEKYVRLLGKLREEAKKYNLRTRDVEKAYFMKNCETTSCR